MRINQSHDATCSVLLLLSMTGEQIAAIMGVVVIIVPLIMAIWARSQVTPVSNPKDNQGRQLVAVNEQGVG